MKARRELIQKEVTKKLDIIFNRTDDGEEVGRRLVEFLRHTNPGGKFKFRSRSYCLDDCPECGTETEIPSDAIDLVYEFSIPETKEEAEERVAKEKEKLVKESARKAKIYSEELRVACDRLKSVAKTHGEKVDHKMIKESFDYANKICEEICKP